MTTTRTRRKRLKAGDHVLMLVRCEGLHLIAQRGVVTADGGIDIGSCTEPGAADDPSLCPKCRKPIRGMLNITLDETLAPAATETPVATPAESEASV